MSGIISRIGHGYDSSILTGGGRACSPTYPRRPRRRRRSRSSRSRRGTASSGPTSVYAFMQNVGVVNDHLHGCFRAAD
ncbi:MAG: DNA-3-methyladenine glycosylase I [Gaiellaceae bacterium]